MVEEPKEVRSFETPTMPPRRSARSEEELEEPEDGAEAAAVGSAWASLLTLGTAVMLGAAVSVGVGATAVLSAWPADQAETQSMPNAFHLISSTLKRENISHEMNPQGTIVYLLLLLVKTLVEVGVCRTSHGLADVQGGEHQAGDSCVMHVG